VHRTIQLIKSHGCQAGLVLNPATPVEVLDWVLDELDLVLLMSVNPGFGGQAFIPVDAGQAARGAAMIDATGKPIRLEVDGGVKADNIGEIAARARTPSSPVRRSSSRAPATLTRAGSGQRAKKNRCRHGEGSGTGLEEWGVLPIRHPCDGLLSSASHVTPV
jgi:hypothetical protein